MAELTPDARAFLSERRFAALATINKDGSPQQTTMWYDLDGDTILMNTAAGRVKYRNLARDPRAAGRGGRDPPAALRPNQAWRG